MSFDESVCVKERGSGEGGSRLIAANVPLLPCPFNIPRMATDNQEVNHESIKGSLSQGSFQTVEALSQTSCLKQLARVGLYGVCVVVVVGALENISFRGDLLTKCENTSREEHFRRVCRKYLTMNFIRK